MKNDFYVYEWYNIDTNEVFYVGKGRGYRYKTTSQRNRYFKNYYNKHNCDVRKVKTSLHESEAFELEKELIKKYRKLGQARCNLTEGGEGTTYLPNSRNGILRRLRLCNYCYEEYEYLKELTTSELIEFENELLDDIEDSKIIDSLDIYDNKGNLNLGWECFEDYVLMVGDLL